MDEKKKQAPGPVKWILIGISVIFLFVMLVLPLVVVVTQALSKGWQCYVQAVTDEYTLKALKLTIGATAAAVVCNTIFGLCAAWAMTRFHFRGKKLLTTLIDVPVTVSPVIAGLIYILVFGKQSPLYSVLESAGIQIVFAVPGIVLATIFVTFPFVSREIIPVLESIGSDEEEAAALMGAKGWTIFTKVTFPHIKWAFLYGVVLCTARAMGEFGAVSVLSGHLRGKTNTLPLHVEILYNEFQYVPAFAVSSILVILAVALVVLGPEKLPLYMKKFGQAMRELKKYSSELTEDLKENVIAPLDEAQRPLREAMEPLENLDKELKANAKDLENSFRDIGKPKKPEETPKEDPAEKAMEAPETAAAAEEPAAETQKDSTNNPQEEL